MLDGAHSERDRGGHAAAGAGTRTAGQRADPAGEPHREPAVPAWDRRLQAASEEGGGTAGRPAQLRRRPVATHLAGGTAPADDASSHAERAAQGDRGGTRAGGDGGGTGLRGAADPDAGPP